MNMVTLSIRTDFVKVTRALGLAAELNGLGLAAYFGHEPLADSMALEQNTVLAFLLIFVLILWTVRVLYVAQRSS